MSRLSLGSPVTDPATWAINALKSIERWTAQLSGSTLQFSSTTGLISAKNVTAAIEEVLADGIALGATLQPLDADLTAVAASGVAAAWQTYVPVVTASVGAFTSVSATGRYLQIGKTVLIEISITITTNGTAAGAVTATLPVASATPSYILSGRELALNGRMLSGTTSSTSLYIVRYDNAYPGGDGSNLVLSGIYEAA